MGIAALIIILVGVYAVKALSIARQHDEIIADDAMMCWEPAYKGQSQD